MPQFFPNPAQAALRSTHQHFAQTLGKATKYPTEIAPFGALEDPSPEAYRDLHTLLKPNEIIYIPNAPPHPTEGLEWQGDVPCLQFVFPSDAPIQNPEFPAKIVPLSCADAPAMLALTDIAFPGFFRPRTCEMGDYFGIYHEKTLVAMCGERMNIKDFREISGLCTHPDHRGKGHAAALLAHLLHHHRNTGFFSYLHVAASNSNAIALYKRLGFNISGELLLYRIARIDPNPLDAS